MFTFSFNLLKFLLVHLIILLHFSGRLLPSSELNYSNLLNFHFKNNYFITIAKIQIFYFKYFIHLINLF